jgi:hypothetical protein
MSRRSETDIAVIDNRTNRNQIAVRDGLYHTMQEPFRQAGIPWVDREDRGDSVLVSSG